MLLAGVSAVREKWWWVSLVLLLCTFAEVLVVWSREVKRFSGQEICICMPIWCSLSSQQNGGFAPCLVCERRLVP